MAVASARLPKGSGRHPPAPVAGTRAAATTSTASTTAATPADAAEPTPPVLRDVLDLLGAPVLSVLSGDTGIDAVIGDPVVHDPTETVPNERGAILLAVGIRPCSSTAIDLVGEAARAGAAAVVIKARGEDTERLSGVAASAGIALLEADDGIPWRQIAALISTATHSAGVAHHEQPAAGDLFGLANAIAATVGGAVSIESPHQQVLAYSNLPGQPIDAARQRGILHREVPTMRFNPAIYRTLWSSPGVVRFAGEGDVLPRLAVAIRAGTEPLGAIFVIESGPVPPEGEQALLAASKLAALYLLRLRTGADLARRSRGELLRALLDGRCSPLVAATRLGLSAAEPATVLAFQLPGSDSLADAVRVERVLDLVQAHVEGFRSASGCVAAGHTVYVVLPVGTDHRARLARLAERIVDRAEISLRIRLRAAIGSCAASLAGVHRSRRDADQILLVLAADPARKVAAIEDVHAQVALLELAEVLAAKPGLLGGPVREITRSGQGRGLPYAHTLRAYLDCFGDVQAAAQLLRVHPNTFRYRLRRARELFGIDIDDPDQRLVLWLHLRLCPPSGQGGPGGLPLGPAVGAAEAGAHRS